MGPTRILSRILKRATSRNQRSVIADAAIRERVEYVARCLTSRAGVRLLMACSLAKVDRPESDPRKPYTEIGTKDSFSGRTYDERYLTHFINSNRLPCNPTTAFLTPVLRNINRPLTLKTELIGRPKELYATVLQLLDDIHSGHVSAEDVLTDTVRVLLLMRDEKQERMAALLAGLKRNKDAVPLSSEGIVTLLAQHLACKNASRLPVLIVAAAYHAAGPQFGERTRRLNSHNAADLQTGAIGDIEVCLQDEQQLVTAYEMKMKRVTTDDVDNAVSKIIKAESRIHNYIFVTTDAVEDSVSDYAKSFYEQLNGTEIAILDCIGFTRHFLHLFHRRRTEFLNAYQSLVLNEPDSAVSQPLKEAFLALRQAAESDE